MVITNQLFTAAPLCHVVLHHQSRPLAIFSLKPCSVKSLVQVATSIPRPCWSARVKYWKWHLGNEFHMACSYPLMVDDFRWT